MTDVPFVVMLLMFAWNLQKAIQECEKEWTDNKKLIDLSQKDIRKAVLFYHSFVICCLYVSGDVRE